MAYGAIDAIGGAMSPKVVKSLRKSGKYILYGALDTSPVSASNGDLLAQTKVFRTANVLYASLYYVLVTPALPCKNVCCSTCFAVLLI